MKNRKGAWENEGSLEPANIEDRKETVRAPESKDMEGDISKPRMLFV